MSSWFDNDLKTVALYKKMYILKKKFDKKHREDEHNYDLLLNRFLRRELGDESKEILREQMFLISRIFKDKKT